MTYTLTDNPAKASIWADWMHARTILLGYLGAHGISVRDDGRVEPADNGQGYAIRIYLRDGRPVEDRIGWLRERRITSRRKVAKEEE